ncbi:MAG: helical backbone metal receptor [Chitinophagales bacterium]
MNLIHSTDQLGKKHEINFPPKRIVSLVPSQTEFLFDIGLNQEITGITRFCIHPIDKVKTKTIIGGTKQLHLEKIFELQPELIIGNKEENEQTQIEELQKHFPVWMSDIRTIEDACGMMREVSRIVNHETTGEQLTNTITKGFDELVNKNFVFPTAAYLIWRKPYMIAGSDTFINELMSYLGVENIFGHRSRYPEITMEELSMMKPQFIFLSSEPYRFTKQHIDEFKSICPDSKVLLVDGEMFSWYGSRLKLTVNYLHELRKKMGIYSV